MKLLFSRMTCTSSRGTCGEFPNSTEEVTIPQRLESTYTSNGLVDDASPPGETFTHVDIRSTWPHEIEAFDSTEKTRTERTNDRIDDQQPSGGSDTSGARSIRRGKR